MQNAAPEDGSAAQRDFRRIPYSGLPAPQEVSHALLVHNPHRTGGGALRTHRLKTKMMNILVRISQFVNKTFALWVAAAGVLGFLSPEVFKLAGPYVPILLGVVMFGMGLTLTTSDFREIFRRPRDVFVGIAAQFTIMPLSAWVLCRAFELPPDLAVGMMLLGCAPGGTASNVVTFLARGDVALSVTITSCTTLLAPVVTPALMYFFASQWLAIDPAAMFLSIVQVILLPIAAGVVVHRIFGSRVKQVTAAIPIVSVAAIVVIISAVVAGTKGSIVNAGFVAFAAVAIQNAIGMALGYFAGRMLGMDVAKCKCLCFEVGMQNSALGVALAGVHFAAAPMTALPSAIGALWHNISAPVVATCFQAMDAKKAAKPEAEPMEAVQAA